MLELWSVWGCLIPHEWSVWGCLIPHEWSVWGCLTPHEWSVSRMFDPSWVECFEDVWSLTSGVFEDVWSLTSEIGWECSSPHNLNLEFWLVKWEQFSKYCWLLNCCFLGSFNYVNLRKSCIVDYPCGGLCSPSLHLFYRLEQWSLAGVLGLFGRRWYFCFFLSC